MFACPARYLAKMMVKQGVPARVAEFKYGAPMGEKSNLCDYKTWVSMRCLVLVSAKPLTLPFVCQYCHNDDLALLSGNNTIRGTIPTPEDRTVQRAVGTIWTAFSSTPSKQLSQQTIGGFKWPVATVGGSSGLNIDVDMKAEVGTFGDDRCDVFDEVGAYAFMRGYI